MANISFVHARDHALVLFVGELDWEAAHELVTTLETVFDVYFYTEVELLVASPGGDTRAFAYYLNAVRNWSKKGVRFRTRVISSAGSAGAFMVDPERPCDTEPEDPLSVLLESSSEDFACDGKGS